MTTVSKIIASAFRESNIIGKGRVPDATDAADGLDRLQAVVLGIAGFEVGESLHDWPVGLTGVDSDDSAYFCEWTEDVWNKPIENSRLLLNATTPQTIYFPLQPNDGSRMAIVDVSGALATYPVTLDGNGRLIEGQTTKLLNNDPATGLWFYRADLANWVSVAPLAADGEFPFPPEFDDAFITMLAMRLNPRYGRAMAAESTAVLQNAMGNLVARYKQRQTRPADIGVLNLSVQAYNTWNGRGRIPWFNRTGWMA